MNIRMTGHEWIEWNGGECPVQPDTLVEYVERSGEICTVPAGFCSWKHFGRSYDIIKYQVIPEPNTEWIEWTGWDNFPVPPTTLVEFRKISGETYKSYSSALMCIHDKLPANQAITHYRVIEGQK